MKNVKWLHSLCLIGCINISPAFSQTHWDSIHTGLNAPPNFIYADSSYLYMAGGFHIIDGLHMQGIARWNGVTWDSMGAGIDRLIQYDSLSNMNPSPTCAMAPYHHKLYVGGEFSSLGYINAPGIGTWNGTAWDSVPVNPFINRDNIPTGSAYALAVINDKLYMGGDFDTVAGKQCRGIACWNDTNWSSLNFGQGFSFEQINAICEYNGSIYAAGHFAGNNGGIGEIIRSDSAGNWYSVDTGIKGTQDWINTMAVYNGELYVGGYFYKSDGNVGDCIQKWNGTSWNDVSGGVNHQIWNLTVYNGKLYAMGVFTEAGGVAADGIAEWDGAKWCSFAGKIKNDGIVSACAYKDSLYIAGSFRIIASAISCLAEWTGGNYTDSCEITTGISDVSNPMNGIVVYPNPSNGIFSLTLSNVNAACNVQIYNVLGQQVYHTNINANSTKINLSGQPQGIYLYRVTTETGNLVGEGKIVVQK